MKPRNNSRIMLIISAILIFGINLVSAQDLMDLSLDDLLNMEVTSVSKKAERLQDVASSLYVITAEDIKNSG